MYSFNSISRKIKSCNCVKAKREKTDPQATQTIPLTSRIKW